ncbi:hypothetical protein K0O13_07850 [Mammaliicoccus sciuri]|uniref:hypothetical protein n=1 Tax=Mammaliicoccus sciuri TaxID=1296 RepID=UPI001C637A07|nr:hypothetical protein [Mammaliicoccus sciuri]QYG30012.1 hypothetical protein K0O13_07850 [Mammaliicoccus sciuri]
MKIYQDFKELEKDNKKLATELLKEKGKGEWQQEEIYYHNNIVDFTEYEVFEGWYSELFGNMMTDFNGAPNLFEYIDYEKLGKDLIRAWDNSINYYNEETGKIVGTSYGW